MGIRRELILTLGLTLLLNLLLAFGTIGVLARMGPAIEEILTENAYSIQAAEEVLHELSLTADWPLPPTSRDRVEAALNRASSNVTEPDEVEILRRMSSQLEPRAESMPGARARLAEGTVELIAVNLEAMSNADAKAKRLGSAGAWTAVFIGALSFGLSLLLLRRWSRRIVEPLIEFAEVGEEATHGAGLRRCRLRRAPAELTVAMRSFNRLLDQKVARRGEPAARQVQSSIDRALVLLLDKGDRAAAIIDVNGNVLRSNTRALDALKADTDDTLRARFRALAGACSESESVKDKKRPAADKGATRAADSEFEGLEFTSLGPDNGWLCYFEGS